jgi:hypothetical protein
MSYHSHGAASALLSATDGDGESIAHRRTTNRSTMNGDDLPSISRALSLESTAGRYLGAGNEEEMEASEPWLNTAVWSCMFAVIVTLATIALANGHNNKENPLLDDPSQVLAVQLLSLCFIFGTENASSAYRRTSVDVTVGGVQLRLPLIGVGVRLFYQYLESRTRALLASRAQEID